MTAARTAILAFTALVYGPPAAIVMGAGLWCWQWAVQNERRAHAKNGVTAAAT